MGEDSRDVTEAQSWSHPDSPWMMLALCQVPKVRGHQEFGAIIWAELMGLVVEQERFANSFGSNTEKPGDQLVVEPKWFGPWGCWLRQGAGLREPESGEAPGWWGGLH